MIKRGRGGFTLMELLVVIAIIGVALSLVWNKLPHVADAEKSGALAKLAGSETALFEHAAFKKKALLSSTTLRSENTGLA